MAPFATLFALFGWKIPEECTCQVGMFKTASSYGMGYSEGDYHGCVGPDPNEFAACKSSDWCDEHCQR